MLQRLSDIAGRIVSSEQSRRVRATWRVLLPVLVGFVTYALTFAIAVVLGATQGTAFVVTFVVTALVILGFVSVSSAYLDYRPLAEYGYRVSRGWWLDLGVGTLLGGLIGVMTFALGHELGTLRVVGSVSVPDPSTGLRLGAFLVGFLAVAIWEELVFRGVFITEGTEGLLSRGRSTLVATAGAAAAGGIVFTLIHLPAALGDTHSVGLVGLRVALAGGLFAVAYLLTGELALPMGLHLGVNFALGNVFGIAPLAAMDGVPTMLPVQTTEAGLWGPENGVPVLVSLAVGYALVVGWAHWRTNDIAFGHTARQRVEDATR